MFGHKERKIAKEIADLFQSELTVGFQANDLAGERLSHMFCTGYMFRFTAEVFAKNGFDGEAEAHKRLGAICERVLPYSLARVLARNIEKRESDSLGACFDSRHYDLGDRFGASDAAVFCSLGKGFTNSHLRLYIADTLHPNALPRSLRREAAA